MFDVLEEALIGVNLDDEAQRASIPQVLAWLSQDHETSFTALQPHQRHPWHAFLVQLAALALARSRTQDFPTDAATWTTRLLNLTGGKREPWSLVVEDLTRPALFQPPVPENRLDGFKTAMSTPDRLDILLTARNFDLKSQRMIHAEPQHWLFALITKQTFEGYSGKLNYGIARMNGGQANRPCISVAPSLSWAPRFRRDVKVWLERRAALIKDYEYDAKGHALLWLVPWDGSESLPRTALDPFFIEVCRRIRLVVEDGSLTARAGTSTVQRIDPTDHAGDTGDIWTPTQMSTKKNALASLTIPASGFTYKKLSELLFGDEWTKPAALHPLREEDRPAPVVVAQALVRGQGKTEGYHERMVPIPTEARFVLASSDGNRRLGVLSKLRIARTAEIRDRVLKPAVLTLLQGIRDDKLDFRDQRAAPWLDRFEQRVDDQFFDALFEDVALPGDAEAKVRWDRCLDSWLRVTFKDAAREVPIPTIHRYPILAAAEGRFRGARRRFFAELLVREPDLERQAEPEPVYEPTTGA